jgi:hypothetical protein
MNNKRKGSNAERFYAKVFRSLGFTRCKTSREASKLLDNSGVDFTGLPWNVQLKAGKQKNLNYSKELSYIAHMITQNFDKEDDIHKKPIFLIHRKDAGKGFKRTEYHDLVVMTFNEFKKLCNLKENDSISQQK